MSATKPLKDVNKTRRKNSVIRGAIKFIDGDATIPQHEKSMLYNAFARRERREKLAQQMKNEAKNRMLSMVYDTNLNTQAKVNRLKGGRRRRTHRANPRR